MSERSIEELYDEVLKGHGVGHIIPQSDDPNWDHPHSTIYIDGEWSTENVGELIRLLQEFEKSDEPREVRG